MWPADRRMQRTQVAALRASASGSPTTSSKVAGFTDASKQIYDDTNERYGSNVQPPK